LFGFLDNFIIK